jgi:hypothetical protein
MKKKSFITDNIAKILSFKFKLRNYSILTEKKQQQQPKMKNCEVFIIKKLKNFHNKKQFLNKKK